MAIEFFVVDENVIVVKGLRSACESRKIANEAEAIKRANAFAELTENNFMELTIKAIIRNIEWASESGHTEVLISGYGNRCSPLRTYNHYLYEIMAEVINNQIFPIFREKGYSCKMTRGSFATNEKYFDVKISW